MVQRYFDGDLTMDRAYRSIRVEPVGDVDLVSFRESSLDDSWAQEFGEDMLSLIEEEGCRKLVLSFAEAECLYSVLLGKLMTIRRVMMEHGGRMKLVDVTPLVQGVFTTCKLDTYFEFAPDPESALADW